MKVLNVFIAGYQLDWSGNSSGWGAVWKETGNIRIGTAPAKLNPQDLEFYAFERVLDEAMPLKIQIGNMIESVYRPQPPDRLVVHSFDLVSTKRLRQIIKNSCMAQVPVDFCLVNDKEPCYDAAKAAAHLGAWQAHINFLREQELARVQK
jgi:hypothetical protein